MNTGGKTIAVKGTKPLPNTEHPATLMKSCIHCDILWQLWHWVSDRIYFLYISLQCHKKGYQHYELANFSSDARFMEQNSSVKGTVYPNSVPINPYVYNFLLGVIPCLTQIYHKWHFSNPLTKDTQDPCIKLQTHLQTVITARTLGVCWLPSMSSRWDTSAQEEFYYLRLQSFFFLRSFGVFIIQNNYNGIMPMVKANHQEKNDKMWCTQEMIKSLQIGSKFQTMWLYYITKH
jgi:hypothetical protein